MSSDTLGDPPSLSTERSTRHTEIFDYMNYHSDESGLQCIFVGRNKNQGQTSGASASLIYLALNAKKGI